MVLVVACVNVNNALSTGNIIRYINRFNGRWHITLNGSTISDGKD